MSIRKRGPRAYQVRVPPFRAQTVPTRAAAVRLELELKTRHAMGVLFEERPNTLGAELDGFLERKKTLGGRRGPLRERGVEWYERSAGGWKTLREVQVAKLSRRVVEDVVVARARVAPKSAGDELQVLKACLLVAQARGQRVDPGIFEIPPVKHEPRRGKALTVPQLYELGSWFPEQVKRLVLVAGQVGARQNFWFNLTEDMVDLDEGTMDAPAALAKNRRVHRVYLTDVEVTLLREQLLARAPGTARVFPTPTGKRWSRHHFGDLWRDAAAAAAEHDRQEHDLEASVFESFTFHLLRHTAGSLMALAGMDPAAAAERLGHTDGGALFLKTYRHLYEGERRTQARRLEQLVTSELKRAAESAKLKKAR